MVDLIKAKEVNVFVRLLCGKASNPRHRYGRNAK
jgi:hypothetical protein